MLIGAALSEAFSRDFIPWHLSSRHHIGQEGRGGRQVAAGRRLMCSLCSIHDFKVGVASLYVASKCEEYYPAELKKLVHLTENSYTVQDVFDMELVLLGVIHFQAGF